MKTHDSLLNGFWKFHSKIFGSLSGAQVIAFARGNSHGDFFPIAQSPSPQFPEFLHLVTRGVSLLNVGPWFSGSAKYGYIFEVSRKRLTSIFTSSLIDSKDISSMFNHFQAFFPRAYERRVLLIAGVCYTSSHLLIFTSTHIIFTSSHLHIIFTSSHLHI